METKPLLYGLIGFFIGGLLVSLVASTQQPSGADMSQMTNELKELQGDDYDKKFISSMIEHHRAAVDMARLSDMRAKHDDIKNMSKEIIAAQTKEIDNMKQWQMAWGYESTDSQHGH